MSKELVITATPHETRVAILEEGQLCEIYVEREKEFALVGSIYKGRVTRVLPGMQSAFVEIGLDSDAFLYVTDFLDNVEEYDSVGPAGEEKFDRPAPPSGPVFTPALGENSPASAAASESGGNSHAAETTHSGESAAPPAGMAEVEVQPGSEAPPPAPASAPHSSFARPPQSNRPPFQGGRRDDRRGGGFRRGGRGGRGRGGGRGGFDRRPFGHGRELPPSKFASHRPYEPPPADENYEPIILPGESLAKYKGRVPGAGATSAPPAEPPAVAEAAEAVTHAAGGWVETTEEPAVEPIEVAQQAASHTMEAPPPVAEPHPAPVPAATAAVGTHDIEPASHIHHELSPEEATHIREHLAEVQQEEIEAAEAAAEAEAAFEPHEEHDGPSVATEANEEFATAEDAVEPEAEEMTAAESAEQEAELAHEAAVSQPSPDAPPTQVRVGGDMRPRFQRPQRRGGRDRDRGRRHQGRPQRHYGGPRRPPQQQISELLKASQEIIVQIAKEPLGKKGARITSHVALPGRFLVYMPTVDHIGVSRKIASSEHRSRLRRLVTEAKGVYPGGFIVRTAAEEATDDEIRTDIEYLGHTWQEIKSKAEQRKAPALLHRDLNLIERILRDHLSNDYTAVWIDNEEEYTKVVEFVSRFQPGLVNRVKLYTKPAPIFEEFGIQQEIDKALRPKVWLKSGGYIVINHTEALVAIDINTGKFVGKGSTRLEDTIVKTNIEAVKEIVRQIRLRDLGGIIVIDFIDMEERKNRNKVMQALEDALRADKAPSKVLAFNEFGLVAITRKRTKQALERTLCQPCPACSGSGMVKSVPTLCYEIQTEARKMAQDLEGQSLTLRVNPEIAKAFKTREAVLVEELEGWTHKSVIIQSDPTLHWEQYDIY